MPQKNSFLSVCCLTFLLLIFGCESNREKNSAQSSIQSISQPPSPLDPPQRTIEANWNLIGFPVTQVTPIANLMQDSKYAEIQSIWKWDNSVGSSGSWKVYPQTGEYHTLTEVTPNDGYWIRVREGFELTGDGLTENLYSFAEGWNLIAYSPSASPKTIAEFFSQGNFWGNSCGTGEAVVSAWAWQNGVWQIYFPDDQDRVAFNTANNTNIEALNNLTLGMGLWVHASRDNSPVPASGCSNGETENIHYISADDNDLWGEYMASGGNSWATVDVDNGAVAGSVSSMLVANSEGRSDSAIQLTYAGDDIALFFIKGAEQNLSAHQDTVEDKGELKFKIKVVEVPDGNVTIKLESSSGNYEHNIETELQALMLGAWSDMTVPLKTFVDNGVNLSQMSVPFALVSYGALTVEVSDVRWEGGSGIMDGPANPGEYTITTYGAGNISDNINPDSWECTIDHGTWIHSAGVVNPGVSSCSPIGNPTHLQPQVVEALADEPIPTHKWWGSIPFLGEMELGNPSKAAYITPDPIYARISNKGVRILGIPSGLRAHSPTGLSRFGYDIPDPFAEVFDGIAVANSDHDDLEGYLKDHSDGSVTVEWQAGGQAVMEATFVHGSPYVYFKAYQGELVVKTKAEDGVEKGTFYNNKANHLGVWTNVAGNRHDFIISGQGETTFENSASNEITVKNTAKEMTLALLPSNNNTTPPEATGDFFTDSARNVVNTVNIAYSVDRTDNSVTVTHSYLGQDGNAIETIAGLHPLHWKNSNATVSDHKVRSARGVIKFSKTSQFSYEMPFVGVLPFLPSTIGNFDLGTLKILVSDYAAKDPADWLVNDKNEPIADTYWAGKSYGKMAEIIAIARSIGMDTEAETFTNWLKAELADWFTAETDGSLDTEKYFVYDPTWSTLLGVKESFLSHQQLNDHHFHYGYFVRAAAEICRTDPAWCGSEQYGPMIDLLIRDYAGGKNDDMFPYLRNFDPANGFSWASGVANFVSGNNNESTSEAANAYGAIVLYGMITGNDDLVDKGMYLHASSTTTYWEYWNNIDRYRNLGDDYDNFPAGYPRITTSIIWGNGASFSTWFSAAFAHILGIQGLPTNPLIFHIGQYSDYMEDYVALGLSESSNGKPSGLVDDRWRDIWWNLWAMTDADAAIADYETMGSNYIAETGESKAHTYHWLYTWKELGHLKTGTGELTANHPAAVAFENGTKKTYIVYNYDSAEKAVTFSDGTTLTAPPFDFSIETVNE